MDTLTDAERRIAAEVRNALGVASSQFAETLAAGDPVAADRWAALAFGLVGALEEYEAT